MARTWIIPAGAGVLSALLFVSVELGSMGAVILSDLAPLPLFAAGLGAGLIGAAGAGATATALVGLVSGLIPALTFAALLVIPSVLLVRQALLSRVDADGRLEWYPPGRLVLWLTGIGAGLFLIATLFVAGGRSIEDRLRSEMSGFFGGVLGGPPTPQLQWAIDVLAAYPAIIVVTVWMLPIAFNGILAQGLLARFGKNLRPSPTVAAIELPRAILPVTALAALATTLAGGALEFASRNLMVLLGTAFAFAGLGVVHALFRRAGQPQMLLVGFYVFLGVFGWPILLLALIGLVDQWVNFRRRFGVPTGGV
jgi:hypothetical protein